MPKAESKATRVAKSHIYKVEIDGEVKLVRTTSRARAIKHFLKRENITASIPTQDELFELAKADVVVENAIVEAE